MKKTMAVILVITTVLICRCNNDKHFSNNNGLLAGVKAGAIHDNKGTGCRFEVEIKNQRTHTIGLVLTGQIRSKEDTSAMDKAIRDCIIEIKQNGRIKSSTESGNAQKIPLYRWIPHLYVIKRDSSCYLKLRYFGDLRKDFRLTGSEFYVRLKLIPSEITLNMYKTVNGEDYFKTEKNIAFFNDTITTPFVLFKD